MAAIEELRKAALEAVPSCWCPYSRFRVTAALEDSAGRIFTGVNVENASYGLTICAERSAVAAAVAAGSREFRRILVYSPDGEPMPCGACRQVLAEFCRADFVVLVAAADSVRQFSLGGLLPCSFGLPGDAGAP